ncbi:MAG: hypothetical protein WCV50_04575 [Patescibacteria group bacterium]|jgi:hypothetical protein
MESQFGTNTTTFYIILPILVIAAVAIVWFVLKLKMTPWQRVAITVGSLFAFLGFAVVVLGVYYQVNEPFASSFKFYAFTAFAPDQRDPFTEHSETQSVLMMRTVGFSDGEVRTQYHPNPYAPTITYLFVPGKFITANLQDNVLTYFINKEEAVENTSLWWALTKDMQTMTSDAANQDLATTQYLDLGHDFSSQVPTGWKLEGSESDAINTVKFGSPAERYNFIPNTESMDSNDMYTGPFISTSSFTIDSRLSARDVANLIQDSSSADKIDNGTDECIFSADVSVTGIGYYAYLSDNTDLTQCADQGTEIGKSMTLVLKNEGDDRAVTVALTAKNDSEFDAAYYSLREFVNLMNLDNTLFQLSQFGAS